MALITGSIDRALLKYPDLDLSNTRLIGWGAGQFFRDYYPLLQPYFNIEYTICPLKENQGKNIHGVEVKNPSELKNESTKNTLIVILAHYHAEIMNQISRQYGSFRTVRASAINEHNIAVLDELQELYAIYPEISVLRTLAAPSKFGIFIQGLVFPYTPQILAWNRLHFPSMYQCMVTWDYQSDDLLDRCRPWLDKLILVPAPENLGFHYRNAVLRSAKLGVEHLAEQNIEFSVRCRSDNILVGSIYQAYQALFSRNRNRGKIAVSLGASWQHVPFHFSEKAMLARTEDMITLWSQPEDDRPASWATEELSPTLELPSNKHFQNLHSFTSECYFWKGYASRQGFPAETLTDSYRFAQSRLLALEPHLSWLSIKLSPLFDISLDRNFSFTPESWNRLFTDSDDAIQRAEAVSHLFMNTTDFWQGKVG